MNFGEKLRLLRQDRNLTQPELAASLGIEQSYLSKLENEKSLPSSDVLNRILDVLALSIGELVDDLDQGTRSRMRQLPEVANHFSHQKSLIIGDRRRWLFGSMLLLAIGAALIYAGATHLLVGVRSYHYESLGVVLEDEPRDIFSALISSEYRGMVGMDQELLRSLRERLDERFLYTSTYRGEVFNVSLENGSRTYRLTDIRTVDAWQNKVVAMLGVFLLVLGASGIVLEKKLSRFQ